MKNNSPKGYCLDAFAILAFLKGEIAGQRVKEILEQAKAHKVKVYAHLVSLVEIYYVTLQETNKIKANEALVRIKNMPIEFISLHMEDITQIGGLKASHKISLGDSFCAAVALSQEATLLTGDPEFKALEGIVKIEWLRQHKK